ncbi:hypothetical protein JF66_17150, partial [Cryobacterium sp. MLB-32]
QTGNYEYNCVLTSGYSYFMSSGEPLTNCKGSYLQKYLDGRQLDSVALAYGGGAASTFNWSVGCILSVGSGVLLVVYPPTGAIAWFIQGSVYAANVTASCVEW